MWILRMMNGLAMCSNGGWHPRDGPVCGQRNGNLNAQNDIDCPFRC